MRCRSHLLEMNCIEILMLKKLIITQFVHVLHFSTCATCSKRKPTNKCIVTQSVLTQQEIYIFNTSQYFYTHYHLSIRKITGMKMGQR